ncbi:interleukin 12 receptor, beta 2a, like isoform X2 [Cololabis saira]|uniref:interleukin 12 receptor, beta 2a, like isoform X2 n=1 Tax=Cololabis saira TaxID=129043 RepID=UPI002AD3F798|nr:interleukin 12 receptor, beta 2a, like isoform X2 [Cololabis saira]
MATQRTRLVPHILLVLLSTCAAAGPPAPPSNLECYRPCDEKECSLIRCKWTPNPKINSSYHLYWMPANNMDGSITSEYSSDGIIYREQFPSDGDFRVWVEASNQYGSVRSQEILLNAEHIIKPPPPTFSSSSQDPLQIYWGSQEDPLEIHWGTICNNLQRQVGTCDVRYNTEDNQKFGFEDGLCSTYSVLDPQPGTIYEFQVRCACDSSLMSDWSKVLRIKSPESAPVGEVDVWRDCDVSSAGHNCFLTWKNLSISQGRGLILVYEISIIYSDDNVKQMNVSALESSSLSAYNETMWRLSSSLKDVSTVSVSAYNALGATNATHLVVPLKDGNDQTIHLLITDQNLTVSWDLPPQFSDNLKQYVVQYKECSPRQTFDWIKVDTDETEVYFQGTFKKYTPYRVSMFAVSNMNEVYQLSTAIGYSAQGAPSMVPTFKLLSVTATDATLFWEPVPFSKQNGVISNYLVGVEKQQVYNVTVTPEHGNQTLELKNLSPAHDYKVWISAVTAAGPGVKVTQTFKTKQSSLSLLGFLLVIPVILLVCFVFFLLNAIQGKGSVCRFWPQCVYEKIPDPRNSHIFRQAKNQINESFTWNSIRTYEPHPKISLLEIVERTPIAVDSNGLTRPVMKEECSQMDYEDGRRVDVVPEECDRTDHRYGKGEYSKMDNSDEERNDCSSSSEEEHYTSGYEKHFMPSVLEILGD